MPTPRFHPCQCPSCLQEAYHPDQQYHRELNAFLATLNAQQRRLYAAVEINHIGRGGGRIVEEITGLCSPTIARGRRQLADLLEGKSIKQERKPVKGRPRIEQKYPAIRQP